MDTLLVNRWQILKEVIEGRRSLKNASAELGVSYRQAIRMKKAVLEYGVRGLVHGNTGRRPANSISEETRTQIVELSRSEFAGLNDTHFSQQLGSRFGIVVSRETVRKLRRGAGIEPAPQKRTPRAAAPARKPKEGLAILWYTLSRQWFSSSPYACCLLAAIDDATGRCVGARFFPFEETAAYLLLLKEIVHANGVPLSIIQECTPLLKRAGEWSLKEQLRGEQEPTIVERALCGLDIAVIYAETKRQKRYMARVFEELQVALVEAMQAQGVVDILEGNRFLAGTFLPSFNSRYALQPSQVIRAWKDAPSVAALERICSFYYETSVGPDRTVTVGEVRIRIPQRWERLAHVRASVSVRQLLDGSWQVLYKNNCIARHRPTAIVEVRSVCGGRVSCLQPLRATSSD